MNNSPTNKATKNIIFFRQGLKERYISSKINFLIILQFVCLLVSYFHTYYQSFCMCITSHPSLSFFDSSTYVTQGYHSYDNSSLSYVKFGSSYLGFVPAKFTNFGGKSQFMNILRDFAAKIKISCGIPRCKVEVAQSSAAHWKICSNHKFAF